MATKHEQIGTEAAGSEEPKMNSDTHCTTKSASHDPTSYTQHLTIYIVL